RTKEMKAANATWVERTNTKTRDEWVPKSIQENPSSTTETKTPLAASSERPSRRSRVHRETSEPSEPTPVTARESLPAPTSVKATPLMAAPKITESAVPSTEELIARPETKGGSKTQTGPDTSASDSWVPKATPKPAVVEPEMPEPPKESMKVASLPKSRPVDNSVDNLLKMAEQGKGEMPHESDHWVPRKTAMPSPEVDLNKEIARVREQERQQAAATKPKVQIRHDVNNPEEGVLPVSSFEKFSWPLYGRHREYE